MRPLMRILECLVCHQRFVGVSETTCSSLCAEALTPRPGRYDSEEERQAVHDRVARALPRSRRQAIASGLAETRAEVLRMLEAVRRRDGGES